MPEKLDKWPRKGAMIMIRKGNFHTSHRCHDLLHRADKHLPSLISVCGDISVFKIHAECRYALAKSSSSDSSKRKSDLKKEIAVLRSCHMPMSPESNSHMWLMQRHSTRPNTLRLEILSKTRPRFTSSQDMDGILANRFKR